MYGGLIAVPLSIPLLAALRIDPAAFWDVGALTMLTGMVFTRFGCLLTGCCSGRATEGWFGVVVRDDRGVNVSCGGASNLFDHRAITFVPADVIDGQVGFLQFKNRVDGILVAHSFNRSLSHAMCEHQAPVVKVDALGGSDGIIIVEPGVVNAFLHDVVRDGALDRPDVHHVGS
jgi:hypothetical protein